LVVQRSVRTLDDIRRLIRGLPGPDSSAVARALEREPQLTKPPGALGRLEDVSAWLAAWQGRHPPAVERIGVRVFAGSHGVVVHGVSAYPPEVTGQMVANFEAGGAAINQLSTSMGAELRVEAIEIARPTGDFTEAPAMSDDEFAAAFAIGMDWVGGSMDLLCVGEMGIGNTTAAAAVSHGLFGGQARDWTGAGTGLDGEAFIHKIGIVAKAVRLHKDSAADAIDILRRVGGRELAAIAGAVAAARLRRIPVVLDGYVSTAAAAAIEVFKPGGLDHCEVGHVSAEAGHRRLLQRLNKRPLLDLGMRLGEGTGAVLASALIRAAAACHAGMATFAEARVSDRPKS
jgi:nicotinate-nucleotide--dimethylbenzimidazole phosphoribosyltransferase